MIGVTELRGLGDIRTAISTHCRSASRQKSTSYTDILFLGMEKLRMDTELAWLARRQARIQGRLEEVHQGMTKLLKGVQGRYEESSHVPIIPPTGAIPDTRAVSPIPRSKAWKKMPLDY